MLVRLRYYAGVNMNGVPGLIVFCIFAASAVAEKHDDKETFIDVFPPKFKPGDVMKGTDSSDINAALDDVLKATSITEPRAVAIGLASEWKNVSDPHSELKDGKQHSLLPQVIEEGYTGLFLYEKTFIGTKGVFGVTTYQIQDTGLQLAIMFSVPFNFVNYDIKFNLKIYTSDVPVTKKLVDQMYYYAGPWTTGGYESRSEYGVNIRGTITENNKAKLIVWIDSRGMDMNLGASRHSECRLKTTSLGYRCWRECTPMGWCWTNESCDNDGQCHGDMACSGACQDT